MKNKRELLECLELSLENHNQFLEFPISEDTSRINLESVSRTCKYFRIMEDDGRFAGWVAAHDNPFMLYSAVKSLNLLFYHSNLKGYKAAKMLLEVHRDMLNFAISQKLEAVTSGSMQRNNNVFERILIKDNWIDYGHVLIKTTKYHRGSETKQLSSIATLSDKLQRPSS